MGTCLALLFLKRANLVSDLSDKLPIDPGQLSTAIKDQSNLDRAAPPPADPQSGSLNPKQPGPTDQPQLDEKLPGTVGPGSTDKGGTKNGGAREKTAPEEKTEPAAKRPLWAVLLTGAAGP